MKGLRFRLLRAIRRLLRAMFPRAMHAYELSHNYSAEIEEELLPVTVDRRRDAVDVGAYLGSYTLALAKLVPSVYTFEPNAELAALLKRVAPSNVRVSHEAASDRIGTTTFHLPLAEGRHEATLGSLIAAPGRDADVRIVKTTTLDAELAKADVGFIKIDVEGAEPLVLAGGRQLIARCRPVILLEANDPAALAAVSDFFAPLDYVGFFVREGRTSALEEFDAAMQDPQLLDEHRPRSEMSFLNNFFFAPRDAATQLRVDIDGCLGRDTGVLR